MKINEFNNIAFSFKIILIQIVKSHQINNAQMTPSNMKPFLE